MISSPYPLPQIRIWKFALMKGYSLLLSRASDEMFIARASSLSVLKAKLFVQDCHCYVDISVKHKN